MAALLDEQFDADLTVLRVVDGEDEREADEEFLAERADAYGLADAERAIDTSGACGEPSSATPGTVPLPRRRQTARGPLRGFVRGDLNCSAATDVDAPVLLAERDRERSLVEHVIDRLFGG